MISPEEAWRAVSEGRASLVDVREPGEYRTVRAPRSINVPLSSFEDRLSAVPAGDILLLCAQSPRAHAAADILARNGRAATVIEGGIVAWGKIGLPLETGDRRVWPMERQVRFGAGLLVLSGLALGRWVNPAFYFVPAFVGGGLMFSGLTGFCGMALILARCPWNR